MATSPQSKERPILFSAPMVRAILEGRKTVTRRAIKVQPRIDASGNFCVGSSNYGQDGYGKPVTKHFINGCCPYGKPGDRLWVRETWARVGNSDPGYLTFGATYPDCLPPDLENIPAASEIRWKPSIHMFRRDSRILLEITDVRVERLQDISEAQAIAEGVEPFTDFQPTGHWRRYRDGGMNSYVANAVASYASLWTEINGAGAWEANPWVWVVEFKQVTP
ncbi:MULTISPECIES: hypothetical protein [unclassified Pseudomonas]|uniref:hypothetical protein n=1 Tax=unclassified Pseudomonas TaxID=196821 RepID=UPI0018E74E49|nr:MULTISPECIES: hypothetical protein [unclassified Pseudomonas]MBJ2303897.1 hypothetical protein [Pseudomonas sp. MF2846]MBK3492238.1 hypothetical protein [Pseudomonas sp. MF2857]